MLTPNLKAAVGESAVSVLPDAVGFGLVAVGCKSHVEAMSVHSNSAKPVFVTGVQLVGCGNEIDKIGWPAIPKTGIEVTPNYPLPFSVQYAPKDVGEDDCSLEISTGFHGACTLGGQECAKTSDCKVGGAKCMGHSFAVPLVGAGTAGKARTDVFDSVSDNAVDVLFVIDNSGSMAGAQKNVANDFKEFIGVANLLSNNAYHLGIVTTDMMNSAHRGKLLEHDAMNKARVISPNSTGDPTGVFENLVKVGTQGSSVEQGLAAAEAALTLPLVYDTAKACTVAKDCVQGTQCVTGGDGNKACGGHNRGFLRKDARLEVVFVSDEEDKSAGTLSYYANFLSSVKGAANKGSLHAHAIIGVPGETSCQVQEGKRYNALAQSTGGVVASICSPSFAKDLESIAAAAFGTSHQFFLEMIAQESTIQVTTGSKPCRTARRLAGDADVVEDLGRFPPRVRLPRAFPGSCRGTLLGLPSQVSIATARTSGCPGFPGLSQGRMTD